MPWGEPHRPANGGAGTTGDIEAANELLDALGVPTGPLAHRAVALAGRSVRISTRFPDGTEVVAVPVVDADVVEQLHDVAHSIVAAALDLEHSPTLWRLAHPADEAVADDDLVAFEEAAVLAMQALVRALIARRTA